MMTYLRIAAIVAAGGAVAAAACLVYAWRRAGVITVTDVSPTWLQVHCRETGKTVAQ